MEKEITPFDEEQQVESQELASITPTQRIEANSQMIAALSPVIKKNHTIKSHGNLYVKVAGGIAIANALGFTISTSKPLFIDNEEGKYYECTAQLLDNGRKIAEAVGYLGMDEDKWANEPIYSKRSMAQTRATARVCRQNFGHFYVAIGASDTAWEEVPSKITQRKVVANVTDKKTTTDKPKTTTKKVAVKTNKRRFVPANDKQILAIREEFYDKDGNVKEKGERVALRQELLRCAKIKLPEGVDPETFKLEDIDALLSEEGAAMFLNRPTF